MQTATISAISELRSRAKAIENGEVKPDTQEAIENRAIMKTAKFRVKEKIYTNLLHERTKQLMIEGDFSLFGESADEVKELFTAVQKVTFSTSARNATAVLVTINPPPTLDPEDFKTNIELFIEKIQKLGYHGVYYYEQRELEDITSESVNIENIGVHVHIALSEGDFSCELRKRFAKILSAKKFNIWQKPPSPQQLHCKFAKTPGAYLKMIEYASHPKKQKSDNSDISDFVRTLLGVETKIEF